MALILGNLDAEEVASGAKPSRAALLVSSALATLLRVFAEPDDDLWTPRPVDPARMAEVPGLPRPRLVSGPVPEEGATLAWSITPNPWLSRRVTLAIAGRIAPVPPGVRMVDTTAELAAHLEGGGAASSPDESWVLKAPLSAAGRHRQFGIGIRLPAETESFLSRHGGALFEPWMERLADYGVAGTVVDEGVDLSPLHGQITDERGRFRGIVLDPEVEDEARAKIENAARRAGEILGEAGYRGAFGIDAWLYRDFLGVVNLRPIGELNARLTFGHVAAALGERLRGPLGIQPDAYFRLGVGEAPAGSRVIPLLHTSEEDGATAWLDIMPSPHSPTAALEE